MTPMNTSSSRVRCINQLSSDDRSARISMPHRTRPLTGLLLFTGVNAVLVSTITPVYDFVCFLPYWERRRERIRREREAGISKRSDST